jgi:hypothetical protein
MCVLLCVWLVLILNTLLALHFGATIVSLKILFK